MAQREQNKAADPPLQTPTQPRPEQQPQQGLLADQIVHTESAPPPPPSLPRAAELKQTEEKVLGSGTVPAKFPVSSCSSSSSSMLKTTSPRLQVFPFLGLKVIISIQLQITYVYNIHI